MPDLFYFNRHFHSMQAGIPVGTFLQKMETIFVKVVSCEKNWTAHKAGFCFWIFI